MSFVSDKSLIQPSEHQPYSPPRSNPGSTKELSILFLNNEFPPLGGGTGTVNMELFKELSKIPTLKIELITSERSATTYREEQFSERIRLIFVPVGNQDIHHSSSLELLRYSWRALLTTLALYRQGRKYDVIFAFSTLPAGVLGNLVRRFFGASLVVSLQGPDIPGFEVRYRYLYPFLKPLIRWTWRGATKVTSISKQHTILAEKTLPMHFVQIPNGINIQDFQPSTEASRLPHLRILIVARLVKRKRIDLALRSLSRLNAMGWGKMWKLSIVGTGDELQRLQQTASDLHLTEQVSFLGYIPRAEIASVYREHEVFLMTSEHEGMSMAMLEAMAAGLVVISTPVGGVEELLLEAEAGIVAFSGGEDEIAQALVSLISDPRLIQRLASSARERAKKFQWRDIAVQYHELLLTITEGRQS